MTEHKCRCGKKITKREQKLNSGLCDKCFQAALRLIARDLGKKPR